jgi:hypothetical protein
MENQKWKWVTILIMAVMSITLIFGVTGCADDNNDGNVIIDDNKDAPANDKTDVNVDVDADTNKPAATDEPATDKPAE